MQQQQQPHGYMPQPQQFGAVPPQQYGQQVVPQQQYGYPPNATVTSYQPAPGQGMPNMSAPYPQQLVPQFAMGPQQYGQQYAPQQPTPYMQSSGPYQQQQQQYTYQS